MRFQSEQKKFLQQHKTRSETYSKAAATMKKQRKKSRAANKSGLAMDKELKNMQILEEEKTKLDAFCEQSLKNVSNALFSEFETFRAMRMNFQSSFHTQRYSFKSVSNNVTFRKLITKRQFRKIFFFWVGVIFERT